MTTMSRDEMIDELMALREADCFSREALQQACDLLSRMRDSWLREGRIDPILDMLEGEAIDFLRANSPDYAALDEG